MRRGLLAVAVLVLCAGGVAIAVAAGGSDSGGGKGGEGGLVWAKGPEVYTQDTLPRDRTLAGEIRNDSLRDLSFRYQDMRVIDAAGKPLKTNGRFLLTFAHGLYGAHGGPEYKDIGDPEKRRLGQIVTLKPGQKVPLTLAWRNPAGAANAVRELDLGPASLPLPAGP